MLFLSPSLFGHEGKNLTATVVTCLKQKIFSLFPKESELHHVDLTMVYKIVLGMHM